MTLTRNHVLLVEDSPINQRLASLLLSSLGCQITLANDGHEAVAAFEAGKFDLILMDLELPTMDGITASRTIRLIESQRNTATRTPIVALTANISDGDRQACLAAGMDGCLSKPIPIEAIKKLLKT